MPVARYWRARGVSTYGGGDVELGAFHLFSGQIGDPQYDKSSLLLHGDGTVGSTAVVDSSARPKTVTTYGAVSLASGGAFAQSIAFNGGHLRVSASTDFDFGDGDFGLSFFLKATSAPTTAGQYGAVIGCDNIGVVRGWLILIDGDVGGSLVFTCFSGATPFTVRTSAAWPVNVRQHVRVCRAGAYLYLFVDGALVSSVFIGTAPINAIGAVQPFIGALQASGGAIPTSLLGGDVDEMLVEKEYARSTADFAPPSAPHPNSALSVFTREDAGASLTSAIAPLSGVLTALQDTGLGTVARFDARTPGFALQWDFGAGGGADVIAAQLGGGSSQALFLSQFDLQYSSDALTWVTSSRLGRFAYPGPGALTDLQQAPLPALRQTVAQGGLCAASAFVPSHGTPLAARMQLARDVEHGGLGTVYGTTKTKGTPNQPAKARVVLQHQRSKLPVRETWSDPVTGNFAFTGIDTTQQFLTLAEDAAGNFRPVAANRLTPEVLP